MRDLYILVDYLDRFESKVPSIPYRSGYDKKLLKEEFIIHGLNSIFIHYSEVDFEEINFREKFVIYTSIEDPKLFYKDYIEDILWGIQLMGGILIPRLELFRAHHNKVLMEILRTINNYDNKIKSKHFGSILEIKNNSKNIDYPVVVKNSKGSSSAGVFKADNRKQLFRSVKKVANTRTYKAQFLEFGLFFKRLYQTRRKIKLESFYRNKFVIQNFINELEYDFKILIFGSIYYIFKRPNRKNDFRASGSGPNNYLYGKDADPPDGIFDYAEKIYKRISSPNLSIDIAYRKGKFYMIEFQTVNFGTIGHHKSDQYYMKSSNDKWNFIEKKIELEKLYAKSVSEFINKNYD